MKVLTEKGILSAPIFNSESGEYVGLVDLRDFVGIHNPNLS